jgi:cytosine/adenosine deaminase-related metal-dependent hydrolase
MNKAARTTALLRAAWVIPVNAPPVPDGAILLEGGRIVAVDEYSHLVKQLPAGTGIVDYGDTAILPALVNAHTHLELTALGGRIPLPQPGFPAWLRHLLPLRAALTEEQSLRGVLEGQRQLRDNGVAVYGDVSNRFHLEPPAGNGIPRGHTFLETLGFDVASLDSALDGLEWRGFRESGGLPPAVSLAAHACYSTSADLIQAAKGWDRKHGVPFAIHVAEHLEEMQFIQDGTGFCRDLLENLGRWVPGWRAPGVSPVAYLDRLGVLDDRTLLVHVVHLTESDWQVVAQRRCSVCFCPRSNASLQVGRPAIETAVRLGVPAALGTDSLASNRDLNLFAEAALVLDHHPGVRPEAVLHMATLGGAQALLEHADFGSIEAGKRAALLAVLLPAHTHSEDLIATVIQQGSQGAWQWVAPPHAV